MSAPRIKTNLRALRKDQDMKIRHAEHETGINRGLLSQIERGILMPNDEQHEQLVRVYGAARWWIELG